MKPKYDKQHYLELASKTFKYIVIYFDVTRPQYEKNYRRNGRFSIDELLKQIGILKGFNEKDPKVINDYNNVRNRSRYETTSNYTFGIPSWITEKLQFRYFDDNGNRKRLTVDEIVQYVSEHHFKITEVNKGKKNKIVDGKKTIVSWNKKYRIDDTELWKSMFNDRRNLRIETMEGVTTLAVKLIDEFNKKFNNKFSDEHKKQRKTKVEAVKKEIQEENKEPVNQVINKQVQLKPATFETIKYVYENGGLSDIYFKWFAKEIFNKSDDELNDIVPIEHPSEKITNSLLKELYRRLGLTISKMNVSNELRNKIIRETR